MKKFFGIGHNSQNVDFVLLVTRIAIAMLMLTHGIPKMGKFAESPVQFMNVLGMGATTSLSLAVFAEVICSGFGNPPCSDTINHYDVDCCISCSYCRSFWQTGIAFDVSAGLCRVVCFGKWRIFDG
jgi:hypothetical protein